MLIAQMTDIHVGFAPEEGDNELNVTRFKATLKRVIEGPNRPDLLVLTGDITDHGDAESFRRTTAILRDCPIAGRGSTGAALLLADGGDQVGLAHAVGAGDAEGGGELLELREEHFRCVGHTRSFAFDGSCDCATARRREGGAHEMP